MIDKLNRHSYTGTIQILVAHEIAHMSAVSYKIKNVIVTHHNDEEIKDPVPSK